MEYFFPLTKRTTVAQDTESFRLDTTGSNYTFIPGQYAAFTLQGETKVFSLSNSLHHKDFIMFATRMRPSPFKEDLKKIPLGTKIKVSPARGRFVLPENTDQPLVLIAGGIGVTPFRSMIEWATHEKKKHPIKLFYSNRTAALTAFLDDFRGWERENPYFTFIPVLTQESSPGWAGETGRLNPVMLRKYAPDRLQPIYYVAGPPGMVDSMKQSLLGMGVPEKNVRSEKFSGY